jgi:hypothetical protein
MNDTQKILKKMKETKKKKAKSYLDYLAEARERETDFAYHRTISQRTFHDMRKVI